ncbi:MAG: hypothetical protein ACOH1Y_11535 [Propionicimonas sp.]
MFMDLKEEGEGAADPTQDEVVDFLTTQEFHVRNAAEITEPLRVRILNQLRTALKRAWAKILPDGETFYAWRNVASECWSRAKRKMAVSVLLGGLTVTSLTGCGGTSALGAQSTTPTPATTTSSAVVTPGPTASTTHERKVMTANDPQFERGGITGPGVAKFGAGPSAAAYKMAVLFTMNTVVDPPSLTSSGPYTDQDLAASKAAMTRKAFADLKSQADKANAGNQDAQGQIFVVLSKDIVGDSNNSYRPGIAPVVSRKTFGKAEGTVYGKNLSVQFKAQIDYRLLNEKKRPVTYHITRDVAYAMKQVGTGWLIDGWTVNQRVDSISPG